MEVAQAGLAIGKPMLAPPGVDPSKVAILRTALEKLFKDPAYLAQCEKARLDCASPSSGRDLLALYREDLCAAEGGGRTRSRPFTSMA